MKRTGWRLCSSSEKDLDDTHATDELDWGKFVVTLESNADRFKGVFIHKV